MTLETARAGLYRRALDEGLTDVAWASVDSPLGPLVVAATEAGLVRLSYGQPEETLDQLARALSPRLLAAPARTDGARRQLDEYFSGRRRQFDVAIDWSLVPGAFGRRVLAVTAAIPFGDVRTYQQVAAEAGSAAGSRAAGNALGANPLPVVVPCHRVVRTGGGLGGYTGGLDRKLTLLRLEGSLG